MAYYEEEWTDQDKALIMADEAVTILIKTYNELLKDSENDPSIKPVLKRLRFAVFHSSAVKDEFIRKAVKEGIWAIVDQHTLKEKLNAETFFQGEIK